MKILWKIGEIAPLEQFLLFSTIFCYLLLDFHAKTGTTFLLRDKRLFEISRVEITRVDCTCIITLDKALFFVVFLQSKSIDIFLIPPQKMYFVALYVCYGYTRHIFMDDALEFYVTFNII